MSESPIVRAGLRVPMADGVRLATDVYRPDHGRPVPAVLLRTYLGREKNLEEGLAWARQGLAFVAQDVRGRYGSEGTWMPCEAEREDGAAVLTWLAEQPWCDGRVVVSGGSLAAFHAWAAALSGHPAAAAVISTAPAMTRTNFEPGGALKLFNHAYWWTTHGDTRTERSGLFAAMLRERPDLLRHLPVSGLPDLFWADLPSWLPEVLAGPDAPRPWAVSDAELASCPLPTLHVGGWHDPHVRLTLHQFRTAGSAVQPRPARNLLVGPWTHEFRTGEPTRYGVRDYGPASRFPLGPFMAGWIRRVLGMEPDGKDGAPVRIFVGGADRWIEGSEWPPRPVRARSFFTAPGGRLADEPPGEAGADRFPYDPRDPFPGRSGPIDQSDLAARPDAVRYATGPLAEPLTILGPPAVTLRAETDAPGTDWVARLHEALPDGRTLYLGHSLVVADGPGPWRLELPPLAIRIPAGHGLCLEITSSTFPEHARNLNTGACRYTTTETRIARQTVHHGSELSLPNAEEEP